MVHSTALVPNWQSVTEWHNVTLNRRDLGRITGVYASRLRDWSPRKGSTSLALSPASVLSTTDVEALLVRQTPYRLARIAAHRIARHRARLAERAEVARLLLEAARLTADPRRGGRVSMAEAALVRVAAEASAGATSGSDSGPDSLEVADVVPGANGEVGQGGVLDAGIPDGRKTRRGPERTAEAARKRGLGALPASTLGNRARAAERVAQQGGRSSKQGGAQGEGVGVPGGGQSGRGDVCVYSRPLETRSQVSVLDATPGSAQGGSHANRRDRQLGADDSTGGPGIVGAVPDGLEKMAGRGPESSGGDAKAAVADYREPLVLQELLSRNPAPGVLDIFTANPYSKLVAPNPDVSDERCDECGTRLQRRWCGRCRVRR